MSRIGKIPIIIPDSVKVELTDQAITVNGAKGSLTQTLLPEVKVSIKDNTIIVERDNDLKIAKSNHGLMRTLINNLVLGVTEGFSKQLEVNGVGYKASINGSVLKLNVGFSHDVNYTIPSDITINVEQNKITVSGIDKQKVGQVASEIRAVKKPEPYKGKGIKYIDERIIRKSGKSGKDK